MRFWSRLQTIVLSIAHKESFFLIIPFLFWTISFYGIFLGQKSLYLDADSYYNHIGFFVDHLKHGIYPLWSPYEVTGAPYTFFLRRIGEFNPVYLLLLLLESLGLPHQFAYLVFLLGYFFLGMVGFYLVAQQLFSDKRYAFLAYLLLLFSSFGAHLFSNYIILIFVPTVWFFYFLIGFSQDPRPSRFLGIFLSAAVGLTTYIPFVFGFMVGAFFVCYPVVYWASLRDLWAKVAGFVRAHKMVVVSAVVFFLLALVPLVQFYQESKQGDFSMPVRSAGSKAASAVEVTSVAVSAGDVFAHGHFEKLFADQSQMTRWEFFISYLFFVLLICSVMAPVNRLTIVLGAHILLIGLVIVTSVTPIYAWLYEHLFGLKFIRQLFYFFWLSILPAAVLLAVNSLRELLREPRDGFRKVLVCGWVGFSTLAFLTFILTRSGVLWGGVAGVLLAAVWISWAVMKSGPRITTKLILLAFFLIAVQGMQLNLAMMKDYPNGPSRYGWQGINPPTFDYRRGWSTSKDQRSRDDLLRRMTQQKGAYYSAAGVNVLLASMDIVVFNGFANSRFWLFDNVRPYDEEDSFAKEIGAYWERNAGIAFVPRWDSRPEDWRELDLTASADNVVEGDARVKVKAFDVNKVVFKTSLKADKFLLMTDSYNKQWHASIDGKSQRLLRANIGFRGLWIPAGEHEIVFYYSSIWNVLFHVLLMGLFAMMAGAVIVAALHEGRAFRCEDRHA